MVNIPALNTDAIAFRDVISGDDSKVATASNGEITSSMKKIIKEQMKFKAPVSWSSGVSVTDFLQTYTGSDGFAYAPAAGKVPFTSTTNPTSDSTNFYLLQSAAQGGDATFKDLTLNGNFSGNLTMSNGLLTVRKNGTNQTLAVFRSDLGVNDRNFTIQSPTIDDANAPFSFSTSNAFNFVIDGSEAFRVDSSGVGIFYNNVSISDGLFIGGLGNANSGELVVRKNSNAQRVDINTDISAIQPVDSDATNILIHETREGKQACLAFRRGSVDFGIVHDNYLKFYREGTLVTELREDYQVWGNPTVGNNGKSMSDLKIQSYRNSVFLSTHLEFYNPNGLIGTIQTDTNSTSYNTSSDYRLKENVKELVKHDLTYSERLKKSKLKKANCCDRLLAYNPVSFDWKTGGHTHGFLAHEYGEICYGGATGEKDGMKESVIVEGVEAQEAVFDEEGNEIQPAVEAVEEVTEMIPEFQGIDQSKAVPDLIAAVQELIYENRALKERIESLEND